MIRRVLRLIGPERGWIMLAAVLAALTTGSGIGLIATAAFLISRAAIVESTATLGIAITWVRLFAVLRATSRYAERYVGHLGTFRIVTRLRTWVFRSLVPLGPAVLDDRRRGDLLTAVSDDVDELQDFYLRVAVPPLAAVVTTAIAGGMLGVGRAAAPGCSSRGLDWMLPERGAGAAERCGRARKAARKW